MLGFWIALCVVVAGVLATMAYYALKAWNQDRRPSQGELNPQPRHTANGHGKPPADRKVRTTRAGRRAR
jgi:hypothetical protein